MSGVCRNSPADFALASFLVPSRGGIPDRSSEGVEFKPERRHSPRLCNIPAFARNDDALTNSERGGVFQQPLDRVGLPEGKARRRGRAVFAKADSVGGVELKSLPWALQHPRLARHSPALKTNPPLPPLVGRHRLFIPPCQGGVGGVAFTGLPSQGGCLPRRLRIPSNPPSPVGSDTGMTTVAGSG